MFGGSFNPPHLAHLLAVTVVLATHDIERVVVVPAYKHPFAKALAPYEDRVRMCELATGFLPRVEVSRVEEELGGESRTLRTLDHLHRQHPDWKLRLLVGADILVESPKWHGWDAIVQLAPPIVLGRAGVVYPGAPAPVLPDVSSTRIRALVASGDERSLEELVPRDVLRHMRERGLYRPPQGGPG